MWALNRLGSKLLLKIFVLSFCETISLFLFFVIFLETIALYPEEYDDYVKKHIMFKDMSADSFLLSAGIAADWPHGRGCYVSEDK